MAKVVSGPILEWPFVEAHYHLVIYCVRVLVGSCRQLGSIFIFFSPTWEKDFCSKKDERDINDIDFFVNNLLLVGS